MMWSPLFILCSLIHFSLCAKVDELRASITEEDQRAFIKCHVLLGDSHAEIYHMIQRGARRRALTRKTVYNLYNQFHDGDRQTTGDRSETRSRCIKDTS